MNIPFFSHIIKYSYILSIVFFLSITFSTPLLAEPESSNVLFIFDASGSMRGQVDATKKIVIAKEMMTELVQNLEGVKMGLIAYGHRRKSDCDDIEILTPVKENNQNTIISLIQSIEPKGKTPITKALILAAEQLESIEDKTKIILISDGRESCEGDPCAYVKQLKGKGINFKINVVGFDVNRREQKQLECIAQAGGGRYFKAKSKKELEKAFIEVKDDVKIEIPPEVRKPVVTQQGQGLRLKAVLKEGAEPLKKDIYWRIYETSKDMYGKRKQITGGGSNEIFKLAAGRYYVQAHFGHAMVSREIELKANEINEYTFNLNAGYLRLHATLSEGAEPLKKDIYWRIYEISKDMHGKRKQITGGGSNEIFKLAAGRYYISVHYGKATVSREVDVKAKEINDYTLNLNTGI